MYLYFFFFNDTATTEIYTLSLHDALPICEAQRRRRRRHRDAPQRLRAAKERRGLLANGGPERFLSRSLAADRKSTRLNSSHSQISYAVFCLKKKKYNKRRSTIIPENTDYV